MVLYYSAEKENKGKYYSIELTAPPPPPPPLIIGIEFNTALEK